MKKAVMQYWYVILIVLFLIGTAGVYLIFGESSYIAVHDNLDLFVAQFQMMKNTDSFFAHGVDVPFLGGITRDNLPSELSLYTLLYAVLPSFAAYVVGYLVKVVVAIGSVWLLAKEWYGEDFQDYKPLVALMGLAYGVLNLFPAFGIPFASIPLVLYLLLRIYRKPSAKLYIALLCYPFLSYFSYFGFFILAYLVVAAIWLGIRDKKVPGSLIGAVFVLGAGYVLFEYRLFGVILFSDVETIRSTMVEANLSAGEIVAQSVDVWRHGMFHAESVHDRLVWWICMGYFLYLNGRYMVKKNWKGIFHDVYNLLMLVLVFNSVVYGIYNWGAFRGLVETMIPLLKGFQFNRTVFFSPFVWYAAFFVILQRMYAAGSARIKGGMGRKNECVEVDNIKAENTEAEHKEVRGNKMEYSHNTDVNWLRVAANLSALVSIAVILLAPTRYNDLLTTCRNKALEILKDKEINDMNYEEFYSTELFEEIKEDIDYNGEWSVAYGIHPAVLEYNGIATLDGYLGFYSQQYKEDFRRIIAPALERVEASRIYYDDWGARVYLYSGTDASVVSATKCFTVTDQDIYMDAQAFEDLGGRYIFSRIELTNAEEAGLRFVRAYESAESPYAIYLYER